MNVCILSMQKVENTGSLLQAYALKKITESIGHSVSFIDIEYRESDDLLLPKKVSYFSEQVKAKEIRKIDRYFINRIKNKILVKKQSKAFSVFRSKFLDIKDENNNKKYDVCVIGSDEVFNCSANNKWGFTSQLFGSVTQASNVITYAASCGFTKYENIPDQVADKIRNCFKSITAFSLRDRNTVEFVSELYQGKTCINMDPVFVYDFSRELRTCSRLKMPSRFCIVYSYYNRINDNKEIEAIRELCREKGMEIIALGAPQKWISKFIVLDPFEMLLAFSKAEFVITDTFHGTIFSAKFAQRFAIIVRESNRNKLSDLIDRTGIEQHLCGGFETPDILCKKYELIPNKDIIEKKIFEERNKTIQYLKDSL